MSTTVLVPLKRKGRMHMMRIDYNDWQKVKNIAWHVNFTGNRFYARNKRIGYLHDIINQPDNGLVTDHINSNSLDNRRLNLRSVTVANNTKNISIRKTSKTGFRGVSFHALAKKFMVQINANGNHFYLGLFDTKEEAAAKYNSAALRLHGEFARLNEVDNG